MSTAVDTKFAEVFVVSDGTGETATGAVRAAMSQFQTSWRLRTFGDVRHESQVRRVIQLAQRSGALVVFTVVDKRVAEKIRNLSAELGVPVVDVLGPLIANVAEHLHVEPKLKPGLLHGFSDQYFQRIEAVEFAVRHDDGMNMHTLFEADLVLTGPSRTSKTPLSMYLAQRGYKTGNVPLIPTIEPPRELCEMDPRKVLGLILDPASLLTVRQARMRTLGAAPHSAYVDRDGVVQEIERARRVFRSRGWRIVDTTGRAVEETASRVLELLGADSVSTR